jgi:hypothetical protein
MMKKSLERDRLRRLGEVECERLKVGCKVVRKVESLFHANFTCRLNSLAGLFNFLYYRAIFF